MSKTEKKYIKAIEDRGFETEMLTGFAGEGWKRAKTVGMKLIDKQKGLRLYELSGWRKYSRNTVWHVCYKYLAGVDRGQYWANRVPSTIDNIEAALDWLKPAEVKKAKGKVLRQGDVFVVEKTRDCSSFLPQNHEWDADNRVLKHPEHKAVQVPFPCKFVQAKELRNGAGRD